MRDKIKWGIVGSGGIAKRRTIPEGFVPATNAKLVSVYGTNAVTNNEVAKQFGAQAVSTLDALLASDIEAVYVASPVHAHLEQVVACARAGKHVLCEKPLGRNVAEAEEMATACRRAGVQFGTAFMMRFHTQHQAAAEIIRAGKLGKPVFARAQLSFWYPPMPKAWRQDPNLAGGGALMDLAGHCIDLLEMCFGPVKQVSCFAGNVVHDYASDDGAVTLLQFANGALGSVDTFFCIQDSSSKNVLELYGSHGSIHASGTIGQGSQGEMICQSQSGETGHEAKQERTSSGSVKISPKPKNIYRAEIEAFSQSVLEGRPNPHQSIELGLHSQKVLAACYDSSRTRKAIAVPA